MATTTMPPLGPPARLLCGPGPANVHPRVLAAMQRPMLGHLDPDLHDVLLEIVEMLRATYQAQGGLVLPLQATGTSGMEAGLAGLIEEVDVNLQLRRTEGVQLGKGQEAGRWRGVESDAFDPHRNVGLR